MSTLELNLEFEADVRRIAEAVWGLEPGSCQPEHYPDDPVVRELDGIARLRDVTHLLMVTTSTKLQKLKEDIKKLHAAEVIERRKVAAVSKWMITQKQLDAQHVVHARSGNVTLLTFDDFRRRFFDGRRYIALRERAAFGSARNPSDDSVTFPDNAYVPLPIRIQQDNVPVSSTINPSVMTSLLKIRDKVLAGNIVILVAPFGGGKSLTTRELFKLLAAEYLSGGSHVVPVVLNLREHWGQEHFDEMLERHARSIGYSPKEDLVIAWRAGLACLLLDGFDEVASQTVVRRDDTNFMRDARRGALRGVRDSLTKIPARAGVWICGRDHYFDNKLELVHALGLTGRRFDLTALDEFTEEGANDYLRRHGINQQTPDWLPRKPLLLAYLTQRGLFDEILSIDGSQGFGHAWDCFLTKIADREASLENAVMDPLTLRAVLERLAHVVRARTSGTGPIAGTDLSDAYIAETRQAAGEGVLAQLQRLPGLTQREQDPGMRSFVDEDMLAALQGGAFTKAILGQASYPNVSPLTGLSRKAVLMASHLLRTGKATSDAVVAVMERLQRPGANRVGESQFLADCIAVASSMAIDEGLSSIDYRGTTVHGATIAEIDLSDLHIDGVVLQDCIVGSVVLTQTGTDSTIKFRSCLVSQVSGAANDKGLPPTMFDSSCRVETFDNLATNNAVLRSDLAPQTKALVTILRKLYCQSGAGRKLEALRRGITQADVGDYIGPVIAILEKDGFISIFNKVVHPVRKQHDRVNRILSAPAISDDPIARKVANL